jgi:undecaprenyl-diphosphatase
VSRAGRLSPLQAAALGALQGPTELLPVSSSGHLVLVPALLRWDYVDLDPELRKSFEVALHAGTALALLVGLRREVGEVVRELDRRRIARHLLELVPAGAAAFLLERPIEQRLGSPESTAASQALGATCLALADRRPERRGHADARPLDGLLIGIAQATALAPGISRNGATLTAARMLGFERPAASRLSRHAALAIIVAASTLKGCRLARRGLPAGIAGPFAAGLVASFASTLASSRLVGVMDSARSYAPFCAYRLGLAGLAASVLRRS